MGQKKKKKKKKTPQKLDFSIRGHRSIEKNDQFGGWRWDEGENTATIEQMEVVEFLPTWTH